MAHNLTNCTCVAPVAKLLTFLLVSLASPIAAAPACPCLPALPHCLPALAWPTFLSHTLSSLSPPVVVPCIMPHYMCTPFPFSPGESPELTGLHIFYSITHATNSMSAGRPRCVTGLLSPTGRRGFCHCSQASLL